MLLLKRTCIVQIVIFQPLTNANLRLIVKHQAKEVSKRLADRNISINVTAAAEDQVLRESYNPAYGARPSKSRFAFFLFVETLP